MGGESMSEGEYQEAYADPPDPDEDDALAKQAALATIFPGRPAQEAARSPKQQERANEVTRACRMLERAGRSGWAWVTFLPDAGMDETWFGAVQQYLFRPARTANFLAPSWLPVVVDALAQRYRPDTRGRITRDVPKLAKVRTPFLAMLLSWTAAGGKEAETRGRALAAVIQLAADRRDVEARVDHFINEYDGP